MEIEEDKELTLGITNFLNNFSQTSGTFKYRYSDFIVEEISLDNKILQHKFEDEETYTNLVEELKKKENSDFEVTPENEIELLKIMTKDQIQHIKEFYLSINMGDIQTHSFIIPSSEDKTERREIHKIIREHLRNFESRSKVDEKTGEKSISASYQGKKNKKIKRYDGDTDLLEFVLHKEFIDTQSAIHVISKKLWRRSKDFYIAGNKDKRGITTQKVVIWKVMPVDLMKVTQMKKFPDNIKISQIKFCEKKLKIGDLVGNHFKIALRFTHIDEEDLKFRVEKLRETGFVNYFGLQRFGTRKTKTSDIGKLITKQEFQKAFDLLLMQDEDKEDLKELKLAFIEGDYQDFKPILKKLPRSRYVERALLEGLRKAGTKNFFQAILAVPRNLKTLYLHALQSYLWNLCASERISTLGTEIKIGDFVKEEKSGKYIIIDEENIGDYTIFDVIIQLVGPEIDLGDNSISSKIYTDILSKEELTIDHFKKLNREFKVNGANRRLLQKVEDLRSEVIQFRGKDDDILDPYVSIENSKLKLQEKYNESEEEGEMKFQAILLEFSLKKGSYATMLIREFLHYSSSFNAQEKINQNSPSARISSKRTKIFKNFFPSFSLLNPPIHEKSRVFAEYEENSHHSKNTQKTSERQILALLFLNPFNPPLKEGNWTINIQKIKN